jgi:hypothetical protein
LTPPLWDDTVFSSARLAGPCFAADRCGGQAHGLTQGKEPSVIYFKCKNCGALIKVSRKFAGKKGKCARCGATNDIPLQSEKDAIPKSVEQAAAPAGATAHAATGAAAPGAAAAAEQADQVPAEEPAAPPRRPRRHGELPLAAQQIDDLMNHLRRTGGGRLFPAAERVAYIGGVYALLALAPVILIIGLATLLLGRTSPDWTRADIVEMFVTLVVAALLLPLCQYVIAKLRAAAAKVVQASPSSVSSTALLDCIAVLLLVGSAVCLAGGAYRGYQTGLWDQGVMLGLAGLVGAVCCFLLAGLALNPESLSVHIVPQGSAGSEAVGILSLLWKMILRFAPIVLAVVILWSLSVLGWAGYASFQAQSVRALGIAAIKVCQMLVTFTAAYIGVYLLFLLYHLMVDLIRALFEIAANTRAQGHGEPAESAGETDDPAAEEETDRP